MSAVEILDEEIDDRVGASDPRYNAIAPFSGPFRPLGLERGLIIRGLRGGALILDHVEGQVYRPVGGRIEGHNDYVCATMNVLWALGDRHQFMAPSRKNSIRHICMGYGPLRDHTGTHHFGKKDLLRLYLRHRLRLRILLARTKVICFLKDNALFLYFHLSGLIHFF